MATIIHAFEQPFHNITLNMTVEDGGHQVGTNDGVTDKTSRAGKEGSGKPKYKQGPDSVILAQDAKYSPVCMSTTEIGMGELAKDGTKPFVGVLMESFLDYKKPHKIMVEGIVPMYAQEKIDAGELVTATSADTTGNTRRTRIKKATTTDYALGIALQKATNAGDVIPVLIGTVSGKGV